MKREELIKKAGNMVIVYYHSSGSAGHKCFAIGWFYSMTAEEIKLKVTSTRFETYESIAIGLQLIDEIKDYQMD